MAEEEVSYTAVVFKQARPTVKKEEETVYDELKVQTSSDPKEKEAGGRRSSQCALCCLGSLCAVLLLVIIGISVHTPQILPDMLCSCSVFTLTRDVENLAEQNRSFSSAIQSLRRDSAASESKITNMTSEIWKLTTQNQKLENEKKNLTEQLQNIEASERLLNISRAQWSVTEYCLRWGECQSCQVGWQDFRSSCYAVGPDSLKTWEEARKDCNEKQSDLVVINDNEEKTDVNDLSWDRHRSHRYWIGLRVRNGVWEWIDGSVLNDKSWSPAPTEGHCALSVNANEWRSVRCDSINRWICEKKGLSV